MVLLSFLEILQAKEESREAMNEASLGRVYQHMQRSNTQTFAILTSWKAGNSKKENIQRFGELLKMIREMGLGYFKLKGHWQECQDPDVPYNQCPKDQLVDAAEPSLFVPGISQKQAKMIMQKFGQDAIVFSGPETSGKVQLQFRKDEDEPVDIGEFSPNKIAQAYSTLKGKNFVFEYVAQTHTEILIESLFKK